MKKLSLFYLGTAILLFKLPAWGGSGTQSASFLDIPVGAAPASLGGAYSALATDAYAPTYNPGGLAFTPSIQLSGQHLSYLDSINYEYASFAYPLAASNHSHGGLGASIQYLTTGDIPGRDHFGNATGDFSGRYVSYALAYGYPITERLGLGVAGKVISAEIDGVSGNAYAGDLGGLYQLSPQWSAAATITNFGNRLNFLQDGQPLPTTVHFGSAYMFNSHWLATAEGAFPLRAPTSFHGGVQWQPIRFIQIRAGYRTDTLKENSSLAGLSVGAGLNVWGQDLAYAWVPYGDLGNTQYFSFLFRFGGAATQDRAIKPHAAASPPNEGLVL